MSPDVHDGARSDNRSTRSVAVFDDFALAAVACSRGAAEVEEWLKRPWAANPPNLDLRECGGWIGGAGRLEILPYRCLIEY